MQDAGDWIGAWRLAGFDLEALVGRRPELLGPNGVAADLTDPAQVEAAFAAARAARGPISILVANADAALYTAKQSGRDRYVITRTPEDASGLDGDYREADTRVR